MSENAYRFVLLLELRSRFGLLNADEVKTVVEDKTTLGAGGRDAQFAIPVYLHLRPSKVMVGRTASEKNWRTARREEPDILVQPFGQGLTFRMYLHRSVTPTHLLIDLELAGNLVYYATPGISHPHRLIELVLGSRVAEHSLFMRPSKLGLPNHREDIVVDAHISFQTEPRQAYWGNPLEVETPEGIFGDAARVASRSGGRSLDASFFPAVAAELLAIYGRRCASPKDHERIARLSDLRAHHSAAEFAELLAHVLFGCELMVLPGT